MTYGVVFQEYHQSDSFRGSSLRKQFIHILWILATVLLTTSYVGNLKSHLIKKTYQQKTKTLNEMIDKDMPVHINIGFYHYLDSVKHMSKLYTRSICQASRDKSIIYKMT